MKITRHSLLSAAVVLATAVMSVTPAMAATDVNVPFSFVASGKIFPAGTYSVDLDKRSSTLSVQGYRKGIYAVSLPADPSPSGKQTVLKFDQIGKAYLLRTVQYGTQTSERLDRNAKQLEAAQERTIEGAQ